MRSSIARIAAWLIAPAMACRAPGSNGPDAGAIRALSDAIPPDAPKGHDGDADAGSASDAGARDADPDACTSGETWDAQVTLGSRMGANGSRTRPLELVVPRMNARKAIYPDCAALGGGCGDCSHPHAPDPADPFSCQLTPSRAHVVIGFEMSSSTVDVVQRGRFVYADWTNWGLPAAPGKPAAAATHRSDRLVELPCDVTIRFVR